MKNLMGVWDRWFWHQMIFTNASQTAHCTGNQFKHNRCVRSNDEERPRGSQKEDVIEMKSQIITTDILARRRRRKLFSIEPDEISYIKMADEMKIGTKIFPSSR
jgi:hypothetical protein